MRRRDFLRAALTGTVAAALGAAPRQLDGVVSPYCGVAAGGRVFALGPTGLWEKVVGSNTWRPVCSDAKAALTQWTKNDP